MNAKAVETETSEPQVPMVAEEKAVVVAPDQPQNLLHAILSLSKDPTFDATKLDVLMKAQERVEDRQAQREFNTAFVAMTPKLPRIKRDGSLSYPVDKNKPDGAKKEIAKYAKWETIDAVIRPVLHEHGFSLGFRSERSDGNMTMIAILRHNGGHSTETAGPPLPCDSSGGKNNIQGWGSSMSYGKRYAATAALNLITEGEDDDGKKGGQKFITDEQRDELQKLIDETGTDIAKFCSTCGVESLPEILAGSFVMAKNMLLAKQQKKARS